MSNAMILILLTAVVMKLAVLVGVLICLKRRESRRSLVDRAHTPHSIGVARMKLRLGSLLFARRTKTTGKVVTLQTVATKALPRKPLDPKWLKMPRTL